MARGALCADRRRDGWKGDGGCKGGCKVKGCAALTSAVWCEVVQLDALGPPLGLEQQQAAGATVDQTRRRDKANGMDVR